MNGRSGSDHAEPQLSLRAVVDGFHLAGIILEGQKLISRPRYFWLRSTKHVRRQNIWLRMAHGLAEGLSRPSVDVKRRSCGGASADVGYSGV